MWLIFALLSPVFHGAANILDNYFVSSIFNRISTFTFFSTFFNFLFLPIVIIISPPELPTLGLWPYLIALGVINVLYTFPYYKALQEEDTSIVTSLFSIGHVFVPILAFIFVREVLSPLQYFGFVLIIVSSALLALNPKVRFKLNMAFFNMLFVSFLLALEVIIYKYVFTTVSWSTGFVWSVTFSFLIAACMLFSKNLRIDIKENLGTLKKKFGLLTLEEFLTFGGSATATLAVSLAPATLVQGIGSLQPMFVMVYALLLGRWFPQVFREKVDKRSVYKKSAFFLLMAVGMVLTLFRNY